MFQLKITQNTCSKIYTCCKRATIEILCNDCVNNLLNIIAVYGQYDDNYILYIPIKIQSLMIYISLKCIINLITILCSNIDVHKQYCMISEWHTNVSRISKNIQFNPSMQNYTNCQVCMVIVNILIHMINIPIQHFP